MACILLWSSAVRVHDSQAYRKMNMTRKHISRILELKEILMSFQTGCNLVNAAVVVDNSNNNSKSMVVGWKACRTVTVGAGLWAQHESLCCWNTWHRSVSLHLHTTLTALTTFIFPCFLFHTVEVWRKCVKLFVTDGLSAWSKKSDVTKVNSK